MKMALRFSFWTALLLMMTQGAFGQLTYTWTGADPSGNWSAPANWSPAGVPTNGNDLVFPGGLPPGDMVSTNDLTGSFFRSITFGGHTIRGNPMTLTNRSECITSSGTNVIACDLTFSGTPSNLTFGAYSIRGIGGTAGELTMSGNVGGGSLYVINERLVITGQFTGGSLRQDYGSVAFYGDHPHAVSAELRGTSFSTFRVQGSQPNLNIGMLWEMESASCPTLSGDGVVGDVTGCGYVILDSTLSVNSLGGRGASTYGWRVLNIHLNGTNVGEYGRLISSGEVTLSGGSISASPGFNPQPGQVFTIVDKTSPGPITTVPGYSTVLFGPEGTLITLNGVPLRLSYVGGDGNDVTLTANTPPVVTWQQPANNAAFPPGFTLSLRARATDSDGSVTNVDFFATPTNGPTINVGQGTLASDGYYIRGWTNPPPGQYQLHAEAVDNAGGRGISDSVQIVVVDTSQPPTNAQTRTWTGAEPSGYWSAPANWSPAGVLVNGDALVFPGGLPPGDMVSTNDLTDRIFRSITFSGASRHTIRGHPITLTNRLDCIINSGTNVIACDLAFTGTPPTPTFGAATIRSSSFDSGDLTVIGNVEASSLFIHLGFWRLVIMGQFTGGSLYVDWYTTVALYGDNPYAVSAEVSGSTLLVQGSQPNLNITMYWNMEAQTPAILSGDGLVGDVTALTSSTRITPDSTLSVKSISGPSTLFIHLNGTNVGEYGRLIASGNVSLSSARLLPSAGFSPQTGQIFTIVEKTSPGAVTGAFFGLPEGTFTNLNGMPFRISYVGGDGNDVTLTATLPRLDIARTNPAQVRLSWPTNYPGFNLQRASAIDASVSWSNHPMSRVVMGSNYTVTQPAATNQEFFRLKQP
jgi:hypothetical protein